MNPRHSILEKIMANWKAAFDTLSTYTFSTDAPTAVRKECIYWACLWGEEADKLISPEAKALCAERGPLFGPMIDEGLSNFILSRLIEWQVVWEEIMGVGPAH